jgi:hypothetical protein
MNELVRAEVDKLSQAEREAYHKYESKGGYALAPSAQAQLFALYLNGSSCEEIAELNKSFSLGMIVKAKVDGLWEQRKENHIRGLLETVKDRVTQVQMESAIFATDVLSAANKLYGTKLKKYIQTGDEKDLGELAITSLKQYKDAVELLLKITGQSNTAKVTIDGEVKQTVSVERLSAKDAALLLKSIEGIDDKYG